jgi:hypothetical protein
MSAFKTITSDNVTVGTTLTFPNRATISNMPTGTANRALITDGSGNPAYSLLPITNLATGTSGQSLFMTGINVTWKNVSWRSGTYSLTVTAQDFNAAASNTIVMNGASNNSIAYGPQAYNQISQINTTTQNIGTSGYYVFLFNILLTNTGITDATIRLNVLVNGVAKNPGITKYYAAGETGSITGQVLVNVLTSDAITIVSTRVSGISSLISSATDNQIMVQYTSFLF